MKNHDTLVIIRKIGDPRIVEIHDKVEMIKFVDGEWQVVLKDGVVHHYPSSSYVFELIDSLNYYNNKTFTVFFVDGSSKTFPNTHDVQITHSKGVEDTMTIVWDEREDCRTVTQFPMHEITTYSGWPFDGKKSEIHIYPIYGRQEDLEIKVNGGKYRDE